MILVVALYTWTDSPSDAPAASSSTDAAFVDDASGPPKVVNEMESWPLPPSAAPKPPAKTEPAPITPAIPPLPPIGGSAELTPPPAPSTGVVEERTYVIKEGDLLATVAKQELGASSRWPEILKLNPGLEPERLRPGMKIKLPGKAADGGSAATPPLAMEGSASSSKESVAASGGAGKPGEKYRVRQGDTLKVISKRVYGTKSRWPEIWVANLARLDSPDDLFAGMELNLPK
jgi:nucleoid-associated protein YgaU